MAGNNAEAAAEQSDDDQPALQSKGGFSAFASFGVEEEAGAEEDEDFGGLMVRGHMIQ